MSELDKLLATAERIDRLSDGLRKYDDVLEPPGDPWCGACGVCHPIDSPCDIAEYPEEWDE